ncbi:unnamed protein product, partial [Ixodes pacificus]
MFVGKHLFPHAPKRARQLATLLAKKQKCPAGTTCLNQKSKTTIPKAQFHAPVRCVELSLALIMNTDSSRKVGRHPLCSRCFFVITSSAISLSSKCPAESSCQPNVAAEETQHSVPRTSTDSRKEETAMSARKQLALTHTDQQPHTPSQERTSKQPLGQPTTASTTGFS